MVALRAGEDGRGEACWREAACGTVSFHDREGERLKTLYLARMPESGKHTLKAQLASEVAHIRRARPDIAITAVADGAPDNWTFLESLSPEAQAVDFWHACEHLRTASDHAVDPRWFETYRQQSARPPDRMLIIDEESACQACNRTGQSWKPAPTPHGDRREPASRRTGSLWLSGSGAIRSRPGYFGIELLPMPASTLPPRFKLVFLRHAPPGQVPVLKICAFDLMTRSAFTDRVLAEPRQSAIQ